jgi:hypothetical protein
MIRFQSGSINSIYDKSHYIEEDIKNVYTHDHAMLKVTPLLRHNRLQWTSTLYGLDGRIDRCTCAKNIRMKKYKRECQC